MCVSTNDSHRFTSKESRQRKGFISFDVSTATSMNKDLSCADTDESYGFNQLSVDLTIILDTNWKYSVIKPILANLLESIDINQYNSNFTLINGQDGTLMINSTFNILDFYAYNLSRYENGMYQVKRVDDK